MTDRFMFHLAFPVSDLGVSERFYVDVLGAKIGRRRADWIDVLLWGHQITLHCRPDEIVREQGRRHFGVVLPWQDWEAFGTRPGIGPTLISHEGTTREQRKIYLEDPDDYVIEIKSYRDVEAALELGGPA